jgi:hypothetical protein
MKIHAVLMMGDIGMHAVLMMNRYEIYMWYDVL